MSVLSTLQTQVRLLLKAATEEKPAKGRKPAVPTDPGDPDELQPDYRVDGAQPSKKDLADDPDGDGDKDGNEVEADEEDGGAPPETTGEEEEEEDEKPTVDEEEGADSQRPMAKSFDDFGNADLSAEETRNLLKALDYGVTPPMAEDKLLDGGDDLKGILDDILVLLTHTTQKQERQDAIMNELLTEIDRLKKGAAKQDREITKAMAALGDPTRAPAAAPRAISKSFVNPGIPPEVAPVVDGGALANEIFFALKAGKMTPAEATQKCRAAHASV
jgi:hypothetical protein